MRIIAGQCRGMRLAVPKGKVTRPMPDRVRQAVFSSLGSEYATAGMLPALHVLDLFAGTGSLGLEAVSRGAKLCCFVEKSVRAVSVLRRNIEHLHLGGRCWIVGGDAFVCDLPRAPSAGGWDLAFVDPPYATAEIHVDASSVPNLLAGLSESDTLSDGAWVLVRHPLPVDYERRIARLIPDRTRTYGTMKLTWFRYERDVS